MPSKILTALCLLLLTVTTQLNFAADKATWDASQRTQVPVVMLSLDGFRHDYLARGHSPTLQRFAASGLRAEGLIPAFPTSTFPNHYSIVTGMYPGSHGIIGNTFYDRSRAATSVSYTHLTLPTKA